MLSRLEAGQLLFWSLSWTCFLFSEKFDCSSCSMQVSVETFTFKTKWAQQLNNYSSKNPTKQINSALRCSKPTEHCEHSLSLLQPEIKLLLGFSGGRLTLPTAAGTGLSSLLCWGLMYKHVHTFTSEVMRKLAGTCIHLLTCTVEVCVILHIYLIFLLHSSVVFFCCIHSNICGSSLRIATISLNVWCSDLILITFSHLCHNLLKLWTDWLLSK